MMSDDKVSIRHPAIAEFCETGDTRATGHISSKMNPAAVPVQHDIPCSNLIFSLDWLYSAHYRQVNHDKTCQVAGLLPSVICNL